MTVYVDIVFFENFILNYIIITSTAMLSKSTIRFKKIAISSAFGSAFSILSYLIEINLITNIALKINLSVIMVYMAFGKSNGLKKLEQMLIFYLVSFSFGGISFMIINFIKAQDIIINGKQLLENYLVKVVIFSCFLGFVMVVILSKIIKYRNSKKELICDLEIFYNGKSKKIKTLLDTGNLLKEPITKTDVIIVEKQSLTNIISEDIIENISSIINGRWLDARNINLYKVMLIPFSSLGNENGLLIGFRPDYIKIYREEEYVIKDVLIGIYDGKLSKTNLYTSLIGLGILNKEDKKNEYYESI